MGTRNASREPWDKLGWLADNGYELEAHCFGCDRRQRIAVHPFARKFGPYFSIGSLAYKLKCGHCGRAMPELRKRKWDEEIPLPHWPTR